MLKYEHTGDKNSKNLLIFLHGFPDSIRLWDDTILGLKEQSAQFLTITYPNYHTQEYRKYGVDFPEIVDRIKITIDQIENGQNLRKILITHDWGAVFGYLLDKKYPQFVEQMIAMDVGGQVDPKGKELLMILSYQITFACCFLISLIPLIGTTIGTLIASIYMRFLLGFRAPDHYTSKMNYPYMYFYKNQIQSILNKNNRYLAGYQPSVPIVYMYGEDKPFQFHSAKWKLTLSKNQKSEFIGVKCGHWIMREQCKQVVDTIIRRLIN